MDSLQGIPVEYKLDTFNKPRTGTTLCHPKIGYVNMTLLFRKWQLATNSPLSHFNGDQRTPSPQVTRHTKLHGDSKVQSLTRPTTHAAISTFSTSHNAILSPHSQSNSAQVLQHQKQTQISMLQIKTYFQKHVLTFGILSSLSSFL